MTIVTYEDEYNFAGACIYKGGEEVDSVEYDIDEIIESAVESYPELEDKWEDGEWIDEEAEEFFSDVVYDVIDNMRSSFIYEALEIKEEE